MNNSTIVGIPSKIVWSGNKFYCIGTTGLSGNSNILQSTDGITWTAATNANIPDGSIRDIAVSPNTLTLSPTDNYRRYFIDSDTQVVGSNEYVQIKNITPMPHALTTDTGTLVIPATQPYSIPPVANTPTAVVYSSGSSLVAV